MMRSMFSGVSGLRVHQTKMDVIAHNISNVNTTGYKSSRVTFSEVFNQTVAGATGPNAETMRGGVNPMQIGLGANVASIDKIMTTGAAQRTDNPFDLMIQGDGFFVVGDVSGTYFTRAGSLNLDKEGNLVIANGMKLMGWDVDPNDPTKIVRDKVKPISITGDKEYSTPIATSSITMGGNINAANNPVHKGTISYYDSVGNRYVSNYQMEYVGTAGGVSQWKFAIVATPDSNNKLIDAYLDGDPKKGVALGVGVVLDATTGKFPVAATPGVSTLSFTTGGLVTSAATGGNIANGALITATGSDKTTSIVYDFTGINTAVAGGTIAGVIPASQFGGDVMNGATPPVTITGIKIDFGSITQFGNEQANAKAEKYNGNAPGTLAGMSIGSDGTITGRYTNGKTKLLGQVPIALFKNPAGLEKVGDSLFVQTSNSGEFDGIGQDVQSQGGKMMAGVLEMSNVDLSQEFTEMITTQRGFQANSRIITTSDDMLQELVNLKR